MANGKAGAPFGNKNHTNGRLWKQAVEHCISRWPKQPEIGELDCNELVRGLRVMARGFVEKMHAEQDIQFYKEFGDRIDGKPQQTLTGEEGSDIPIGITVRYVRPGEQKVIEADTAALEQTALRIVANNVQSVD